MGKKSALHWDGPSTEAIKLLALKVIELLEERNNSGARSNPPAKSKRRLNTDRNWGW